MTVVQEKISPTWLVTTVSTAIALCILGDSLLYSILPLEAENLGISLTMVGVLLSANRLVRLLSNTWASYIFERWGPRLPFLVVTCMGLTSTLAYGIVSGVSVFLGARLLWGIAWSGLRQGGFQAVWHGDLASKGRLTGLLWGIVRLGSALSVLCGGFLYDRFGYPTTITVITIATALALPVAWSIRWPSGLASHHAGQPAQPSATLPNVQGWRAWLITLQNGDARWLVGSGILQLFLSGVILSTTSIYLAGRLQQAESSLLFGLGVASITGVLQGVRWLNDLTFGPAIGRLSDRIGQPNMALLLVLLELCAIVGLATLEIGLAIVCLFVIFMCDSGMNITLSAAASGVARRTAWPHRYVGIYTTATDFGSALGPLLAFSIGRAIGLPVAYTAISIVLTITVWRYRMLAQQM